MAGIQAVLGFALWTLLLVLVSVNWRVSHILRGKPANSWNRGESDSGVAKPPVILRMEHAHMNALENLPIFAVLVFAAYFMNRSEVVDGLARYVLGARIAQSVVHLIGTTPGLVIVRAGFWVAQVLMFFYMFWKLLG